MIQLGQPGVGALALEVVKPIQPHLLRNVVISGLLTGLLLAGVVAAGLFPGRLITVVGSVINAMHGSGMIGLLTLVLVQVFIAASGVLPASLIGLAVGAAFGVPLGFALAGSSTMVGALLAFRITRSLFRPHVERLLARRLRLANFDAGLARERWRLVCLMRISPLVPFAAASYTLGLSAVTERDYLLGTLAAMPALLGYVCIGAMAHIGLSAGVTGTSPMHWMLIGVGVLASVLLTFRVGWLVASQLPSSLTMINDRLTQN